MIGNSYVIKEGKFQQRVLMVMEKKHSGGYYCIVYPGYDMFVMFEDEFESDKLEFLEKIPDEVFQQFFMRYKLSGVVEEGSI